MAQPSPLLKETPTATWNVLLADRVHTVQLVHGTISGKRVIFFDGVEVHRKNWMIALVGREEFKMGGKKFILSIEPDGMFFTYTLFVNGKRLDKFVQAMKKSLIVWTPTVDKSTHRVTLDKTTVDLYVDGEKIEMESEFSDEGTESYFTIGNEPALLRSFSSGVKKEGIVYQLYTGEECTLVPAQKE